MVEIETAKICEKLLSILVSHKVPMHALDGVLKHLEGLAYERTPIQNVKSNNAFNVDEFNCPLE